MSRDDHRILIVPCSGCGKPLRKRIGRMGTGKCPSCASARRKPAIERFYSYVRQTHTCWVWIGMRDERAYGRFWWDGRLGFAHRFSYQHRYGPTESDLDHLCRMHWCVNPEHLEPVTHTENVRRGRSRRLTREDVLAIRSSAEPELVLAARFGISRSYVGNLRSGRDAVWADAWPSEPRVAT